MAIAESAEGPKSDHGVRVKLVCSHCDRVFVRHSRRGYTARCPHCGTVNAGPALLAEQGKAKDGAARGRTRRRAAHAERQEAAAAGPAQAAAPAPVRRKRTAPAPASSGATDQPAASGSPAGQAGSTPAAARRRGLIDRLIYGSEDE